uniref:RRM domain-containing protein n=2 Tax=Onchocerca TaxID=6281 RepID=A0A8R1U2U8_ONCVO
MSINTVQLVPFTHNDNVYIISNKVWQNKFNSYGYGAYGYGQQVATPYGHDETGMMQSVMGPGTGGGGSCASSGGAYNARYHFQAAQNAGFDTGSEDHQPRTVYVGNLDPSITEDFITTLFGQIGAVTKTKVIFDGTNDPYAFVEFADHYTAAQALQAMNKRVLLEKEMKVNWATEPGSQAKVDTSKHFHVFVGDLSPEVDNKALKDAFAPFGEVSDAKVIRDATTLKSKGYGFVSYPKREEAERAIEQMNGQWLGRRTIRTNWATRKPTGTGAGDGQYGRTELNYDDVYNQTGPDNTSVYVGNVNSSANDEDLRAAFDKFGRILEVRIFKSQGYAFVRFDKKDSACNAICKMNGQELCGQNIKCSWGRTPEGHNQQATAYNQAQAYANYGGYGAYGYGNGASAAPGGSAAAQQQYWNYYQQYYSNPQLVQQQWQSYWQQQQPQGGNQ